uniref:Uncharacterized protein n=1 Tax=Castor canadensis TaxID=51338 RepID=A0A8C0WBY2_CASCN
MSEKTQKSWKPSRAVVLVLSEIRDLTIARRRVIHLKAQIIAQAGPILIGEDNLIEEQALITNAYLGRTCSALFSNFCNNKKDKAFLLVEISIAIQRDS